MAKIIKQLMKNGFVVLNVNTNENTFASILNGAQPENTTIDQRNTASRASSNRESKSSQSNILPISLDELSTLLGVSLGVLNTIDLQGSRLYGTDHSNSDWDIIVIGDIPSFVPNALKKSDSFSQNIHLYKEIVTKNGDKIQAHMFTTEGFYSSLNSYDIPSIEVLYHLDRVKALSEKKFEMQINNEMLLEAALKESSLQWTKAKDLINNPEETDKYPALKRVWHSFRYLIFTEQILKYGKIIDFSAANYLYNGIINAQFNDFSYFEENYLPLKIEIQNRIKSLVPNNNNNTLPDTAIFQLVSQGAFSNTSLGNKFTVVNASGSTSGSTSTGGDSVVVNTVSLGDGKTVALGDNVGGLNTGTALGDTALDGGIVLGDNVVISDGLALINGLGLGNGAVLGGDVILGDGIVISSDGIISVKSDTI
jgi:hypothetical protein